jgi:DNA polymerase-3 subunit delta'
MKVIGHEKEKDLIKKYLDKNYDSLSLLYEGKDCIGKKLIALYTARAFLCDKKVSFGCGECNDCKLVNNLIRNIYDNEKNENIHPNIKLVSPEKGKEIKIDQIRDAVNFLKLKSEKGKVIIIENAENMNLEASNALLKTLEEPPENTLIILTTSNQNRLLPTIVSRTKKIRFKPLTKEEIFEILSLRTTEEKAKTLASISQGSLCLPMHILQKEKLYKYGKDLFSLVVLSIENGKKIHPEGIISISEIIDKLENEDIFIIVSIFEIFVSRKALKGEINTEIYDKILNELNLLKTAIRKGVKKKLALEGFYFNITT